MSTFTFESGNTNLSLGTHHSGEEIRLVFSLENGHAQLGNMTATLGNAWEFGSGYIRLRIVGRMNTNLVLNAQSSIQWCNRGNTVAGTSLLLPAMSDESSVKIACVAGQWHVHVENDTPACLIQTSAALELANVTQAQVVGCDSLSAILTKNTTVTLATLGAGYKEVAFVVTSNVNSYNLIFTKSGSSTLSAEISGSDGTIFGGGTTVTITNVGVNTILFIKWLPSSFSIRGFIPGAKSTITIA